MIRILRDLDCINFNLTVFKVEFSFYSFYYFKTFNVITHLRQFFEVELDFISISETVNLRIILI